MKVSTDKDLIEKFLTRGVEKIYPSKNFLEDKLNDGKKLRIYLGIDPTGPTLHLGHAIILAKLKEWQELGHEVVLLIGSFTGMIGDPTDKIATRKTLTRAEVLANAKKYKKQAANFIKFSGNNPAKIVYNHKWLEKLNFKEVVNLASKITVQRMMERDMFEKRMYGEIECPNCGDWSSAKNTMQFYNNEQYAFLHENELINCLKCMNRFKPADAKFRKPAPIYLHEFLYPLMQGYDSVVLNTDGEIGGNDQTFNMLTGRDLMKSILNKEKFVITMKLLVDPTGVKMGKTTGNMITMEDEPKEMYGKVMSWPDTLIISAFEICTRVDKNECERIETEIKNNANPRDYKMRLACEIVAIYYGEKKAKEAEENFIKMFQKKETPEEVKSQKSKVKSMNIVELLVEFNLAKSKGEARRLIEQGGIKIAGEVIKDINKIIEIPKDGVLVQRGKRQFIKVIKE